ncbi:MAG TPA: phospholipase D-like domain-containing protein [Saprospiraceae bacterium]|nr:phospholipase D-like domain-containing protein [Saprospiraceae bacterium]
MLIRPLCSVLIALLPLSFNAQTFRPAMPAEAVTQQASSLFFTDAPTFTGLQTTGFTVHWATSQPSTAKLHYGASPDLGSVVSLPGESQVFDWPLSGLQPGTIYWVRVEVTQNGTTLLSDVLPCATVSLSSGQIKVFFNHSIDESLLGSTVPFGQDYNACRDEILARIDAAQQTIDVAMYNNNRTELVNALKQAYARGVRVRYIAAEATNNTALSPSPNFSVLYGNDEALMHNKFLVIDADLPDAAWVMSGSMNWTYSNMTDDYNNMLSIQDQSLAKTYELEFEEMWGSDGAYPVYANSRFGSQKLDNTPHNFIIGGIPVECWFSPSDEVTDEIVQTIQSAQYQADFALFTFTHNDPGDALLAAFNSGTVVRGIIENIDDSGCEYDYLAANGVPVVDHPASALLHHKYLVVDAFSPASDPMVLTGSHNWSYTAESSNDENTLRIHSADIARMYAAEFASRWAENTTAVGEAGAESHAIRLITNPVRETLSVQSEDIVSGWHITDALGRRLMEGRALPGAGIDVQMLDSGVYYLTILTSHGVAALSFQKI